MAGTVVASFAEKFQEQVELLLRLIARLPPDGAGWRPPETPAFSTAELLGHLFECLGGACAVLYRSAPESLAHFEALRRLPVNQPCDVVEATRRVRDYGRHLEEGFRVLTDETLGRRVPTVFVPEGETVATLLLGNLEHVVNHKFQLFSYLKRMGVAVGTADLYRFRG
jgi:hypothetical protein